MAELLLAEMLVSFRLAQRKKFWLRIAGAVTVCIGVAFAMPVLDDGALFATFMYLAFFGVTLVALWFCFDVDFRTVAFCGLAGYAMQHISYELFDIAAVVMGVHNMSDGGDHRAQRDKVRSRLCYRCGRGKRFLLCADAVYAVRHGENS